MKTLSQDWFEQEDRVLAGLVTAGYSSETEQKFVAESLAEFRLRSAEEQLRLKANYENFLKP